MGNWYVIRTNIKCEDKAEREVRHAGFEVYLPQYKVESYNRRKRKRIINTFNLFQRYLFVRVEHEGQLGLIRACNGVEDILPGRPHPSIEVPEKDVLELRTAQADMLLDDTTEARRRRGETTKNTLAALRRRLKNRRVLIKQGPFVEWRGTIDKVESLGRLRVLIEILGRETPVELSPGDVEVLDQSSRAA